jgi:hypothetical protein
LQAQEEAALGQSAPDLEMEFEEEHREAVPEPAKQSMPDTVSQAPSRGSKKSSKKSKGSKKPAWAMSAKQIEDEKEQEIDDLIEFAYDLDYEKFMEDYEVRQALAIIKDRVNEIKQDDTWKDKATEEWNQQRESKEASEQRGETDAEAPRRQSDNHSVYSYSKFNFLTVNFFFL